MDITPIVNIDNKKHIALLDTSSISFMQGLKEAGTTPDTILEDYDLILIPEWVLTEISDSEVRADYVQMLIEAGYPIYSIEEETYSDLANNEEGNLYQIVLSSTYQLSRIKSYLRRFVEKADPLDMEAYKDWINKLYDEWSIPGSTLASGRVKKKNAGEVSITILAEARLRDIFTSRIPIPVSYKSNDAILCQLFREGKISLEKVKAHRKDIRKITYSKEQDDHSVILVTEVVDNDSFVNLIQDSLVHIIF
jgi:hypothetical protein